jgi:c-di-GMP-binding flagellar brake protein YcgR
VQSSGERVILEKRDLKLEEVREEILRGRALDIAIGTRLQIQIGQAKEGSRLVCSLVGFEPEGYLLLRVPAIPGVLDELVEGAPVVVRYVYAGAVYGFKTFILNRITRPALILFISYPRTIEVMNLRKTMRLQCLLPASATVHRQQLEGVILDISAEGCRLYLESFGSQELPAFRIDQAIVVSLELAGIAGSQIANGKVQNFRQDSRLAEIGIKFDESNTVLLKNIRAYINSLLKLRLPNHPVH